MGKIEQTGTNPGMTEVMLVEKAEILTNIVFPTFNRFQLIYPDSVKSLGVIVDPTLLLEKHVNAAAKKISSFQFNLVQVVGPTWTQLIWPPGSTP